MISIIEKSPVKWINTAVLVCHLISLLNRLIKCRKCLHCSITSLVVCQVCVCVVLGGVGRFGPARGFALKTRSLRHTGSISGSSCCCCEDETNFNHLLHTQFLLASLDKQVGWPGLKKALFLIAYILRCTKGWNLPITNR